MHCPSSTYPGVFAPGGFAEFVRTGARAVVPIPEGLQPTDVASLACAGLTVYHAVKKALPLAYLGSSTVILGAGGLGHVAIQLMRALSQTDLIVVDRSSAALDHAKAWGADHTVLATESGDHVEHVRDIT